jgi:glycosyltransferase involved in cell wall biosynthesis
MLSTVWRFRHAYDVAVVEVFSGAAFLWSFGVGALLRAIRKPHILSLHGGALPVFADRWPLLTRSLICGAEAVTVPSLYLERAFASIRSDIHVIRNGIDLPRYSFRHRTTPAPLMVWLRAFHEIYNPCLAIKVVADLVKSHPDSSLVMFGPDKDGSRAKVERAVDCLGLEGAVKVNGAVPKSGVPAALASGDIFLNTTTIDNAPISVVEAMACGLCVVSTDVGGLPALVEDRQTGLLVPSNDVQSMVSAVEEILRDRDLAGRLSQQAREVAKAYDWSTVLDQWAQLLEGIAAQGR